MCAGIRHSDFVIPAGGGSVHLSEPGVRIGFEEAEFDKKLVHGHERGLVHLEGEVEVEEAVALALKFDQAAEVLLLLGFEKNLVIPTLFGS